MLRLDRDRSRRDPAARPGPLPARRARPGLPLPLAGAGARARQHRGPPEARPASTARRPARGCHARRPRRCSRRSPSNLDALVLVGRRRQHAARDRRCAAAQLEAAQPTLGGDRRSSTWRWPASTSASRTWRRRSASSSEAVGARAEVGRGPRRPRELPRLAERQMPAGRARVQDRRRARPGRLPRPGAAGRLLSPDAPAGGGASASCKETTEKAPDFLPAWRLLARARLRRGQARRRVKALDVGAEEEPLGPRRPSPAGPRAPGAKARRRKAIQEFQQVLKVRAAACRRPTTSSRSPISRPATPSRPRASCARSLNAAPGLRRGHPAARRAEHPERRGRSPPSRTWSARSRRQPQAGGAYMLLGTAYLARSEPAKAVEAARRLAARGPEGSAGPLPGRPRAPVPGQARRGAARSSRPRSSCPRDSSSRWSSSCRWPWPTSSPTRP